MKDEKRLQRRKRLMDNNAYQTMQGLSSYMDRYYLDALIGIPFGKMHFRLAKLALSPFGKELS